MLKENNYYFSHDNETLAWIYYVQSERWREIDLSYENILIITIVLSNYNMQMVLIYDGSAMNFFFIRIERKDLLVKDVLDLLITIDTYINHHTL
jgi:hypothetical protein